MFKKNTCGDVVLLNVSGTTLSHRTTTAPQNRFLRPVKHNNKKILYRHLTHVTRLLYLSKYMGYSVYVLFALTYGVLVQQYCLSNIQQRRGCLISERRSLLPAGRNDRYNVFRGSDNGRTSRRAS